MTSGTHRRWLWLLLLLPTALGLFRLRFDVEILNLLPRNSRAVQGLAMYQQEFASAGELIIAVRTSSATTASAAAQSLAKRLRQDSEHVASVTWEPPWQEFPAQTAELVAYLWMNQPPEVIQQLEARLSSTNLATLLEQSREALALSFSPEEIAKRSYDPYGLLELPATAAAAAPGFSEGAGLFASAAGTFRIIFVQPRGELRNYRECRRWFEFMKSRVGAWQSQQREANDLQIEFTGRPAFVSEISGGMERDINSSVGGTLVLICLLFWGAHRRFRPLLWLILFLLLILVGTLAIGGLIFRDLNVVSAGFAAILLGLGVDYGLVLYQELSVNPTEPARELRRKVGPSIGWAALTTAAAFFVLNWSGLPGIAQLGTLVSIGILLSALVMLFGFLPVIARAMPRQTAGARLTPRIWDSPRIVFGATALLSLSAAVVLALRWPGFDSSPDGLRPKHSAAYSALADIKLEMSRGEEPFWFLTLAPDPVLMKERLAAAEELLREAVTNRLIASFTLPTPLWPNKYFQEQNRSAAARLSARGGELGRAALAHGFTREAVGLTENMMAAWRHAAQSSDLFWPTNTTSRWLFDKFAAHHSGQWIAAGLIHPMTNRADNPLIARKERARQTSAVNAWAQTLPSETFILTGWDLLGAAMKEVVRRDAWRVLAPMFVILIVSLLSAFRSWIEVLLSLGTLALSALLLTAVMSVADWSWNLLNLTALPLLLGAGVDYSIHMQLGLRRHGGSLPETRRSIGRALFLCAGTTVAGFGSLAWAGNAGLASLGEVCATGIALTYLTSVFLLPGWWQCFRKASSMIHSEISSAGVKAGSNPAEQETPHQSSSLYRAELWRAGLSVSRVIPPSAADTLAKATGGIYWLLNRRRREIAIENLRPAFAGDRDRAEAAARALFSNFSRKLYDLWRYESGCPIQTLFSQASDWQRFQAAQARGRGVLLLTPHLGNWELGGPLLSQKGIPLCVITLGEPDGRLTQLRQAARARWGIETLVVGENPFGFIEIIRRLEKGATVALLVDRPHRASAVRTTLFGRPFDASIAAAELARASGCALLPVVLPRLDHGYSAYLLPEIDYVRSDLGSRAARIAFTQRVIQSFESSIQKYISQWYHFIPIWPK